MEHREAGFPVFARGQSTLGQKPFTRPSQLNVPLKFSPHELELNSEYSGTKDEWPSVLVRPGDWIVADQDGVVVVPIDMMEQVNNACRKGRELDESCKAAIIAGEGVAATFKKYRGK
jgi:regulator of RNase E activity RraA